MFVLNNSIEITNLRVMTELVSSSSMKTPHTPYRGIQGLTLQFWNNFNDEIPYATIAELFDNEPEFDADSVKPLYIDEDDTYTRVREEENHAEDMSTFNPSTDLLSECPYLRKLEEIDIQYLLTYAQNLIFRFRYQSALSGLKAQNRQQPVLPASDDGEDGDNELKDLRVIDESPVWSEEARAEAEKNFPYTLRKLHNFSKKTRIHMLTFLRALYLADKSVSGTNYEPTRLYRYGLYKASSDTGDIMKSSSKHAGKNGSLAAESRTGSIPKLFNWYHNPDTDLSYHAVCKDFLHYCEVLGIDMEHDDFTKYDSEFTRKLHVPMVTRNAQYSKMMADNLRQNAIVGASAQQSMTVPELIRNTLSVFRELSQSSDLLQESLRLARVNSAKKNELITSVAGYYCWLLMKNNQVTQLPFIPQDVEFAGGLVCTRDENNNVVPILFNKHGLLDPHTLPYNYCLLTDVGVFVNLSDNNIIYTSSVVTMYNGFTAFKYDESARLGTIWSKMYL